MTSDERATALLLASWYDWVPGPKTSTGQIVARGAVPGEAPSAKRDCPACGGEGRRRVRGIEQPCERCSGRGLLVVDAYTNREIAQLEEGLVESIESELAHESSEGPDPSSAGSRRAARKARQDAEVYRLQGLNRVRAGEEATGDALTAAWDARERQYAAGDYAALERAMAELRAVDQAAHDALLVVHVLEAIDPGLRRIGSRLRERATEALPVLAATLRVLVDRPVRVPPWVREADDRDELAARRQSSWYGKQPRHDRARHERNAEIRARATNGESAGHIADGMGLTRRRVEQVIASGGLPVPTGATGTFAL